MFIIRNIGKPLLGSRFAKHGSTLSISWEPLLGTRVYKAVAAGADMSQRQSIAISVTKCISAAFKLDTGRSFELAPRCLMEEVYWTNNHAEDVTACFRHAVKPGILLASDWPYRFKKPRNDSQRISIQDYKIVQGGSGEGGESEIDKEISGRPLVVFVASHKSLKEEGTIITHQSGEGNTCRNPKCSKKGREIKSLCLDCGYGKKWRCVVLSGSGPEVWQINTIEGEYINIHKKNGCSKDPNQLYGPLGINQVAWYPIPPKRWNK